MTTAHTPTPWTLGPWIESDGHRVYALIGRGKDQIASVSVYGKRQHSGEVAGRALKYGGHQRTIAEPIAEADAAHIVRCVNSHDALVAALDALSLAAYGAVNAPGVAKYQDAFESAQVQARAALAAAKGEA